MVTVQMVFTPNYYAAPFPSTTIRIVKSLAHIMVDRTVVWITEN